MRKFIENLGKGKTLIWVVTYIVAVGDLSCLERNPFEFVSETLNWFFKQWYLTTYSEYLSFLYACNVSTDEILRKCQRGWREKNGLIRE